MPSLTTPSMELSERTLRHHARRLSVPVYDRRLLRHGVVHLSVGSFHRSHQAVYFDELARQGERDWAIVGAGLRRPQLGRALLAQDGLYTVVTRGAGEDRARVVGAMTRFLFAARDGRALLDALADPRTAVVTLTITGEAYRSAGGLAETLGTLESTAIDRSEPPSALAYLVEALARRRRAGSAPFTVLSCDNLQENGAVARAALVAVARASDEGLASWIEERVEFPNSMVDRITPHASEEDQARLARDFGVLDRCPVVTEPFSQWILEDRFSSRRPPLDRVGVQLVEDAAPYALMKTRLLNASHCAIGFLGSLAGLRRADEVLSEPIFRSYLGELMDREVTPLLAPVPGIDLGAYKRTLLTRLANPKIGDDLQRLCRAGSSKVASHVVPSIVEARERGAPDELLTLAVAGWLRHLRGTDERGRPLRSDDPLAGRLRRLALASGTDPRPLLGESALLGDLRHDPAFMDSLENALVAIERHGVRAAIDAALATRAGRAAEPSRGRTSVAA